MDQDELIRALEKVNSEYIDIKNTETPEYVLGRRIKHFKESFPLHTLQWVRNYKESKRRRELSEAVSSHVSSEDFYYAHPEPALDKKGVVYTCITGGYDDPYEPIYKSDYLDYVLFTDKNEGKKSCWRYELIDNNIEDLKGNKANRYYKFHPFEIFSQQYDYSIYIDGNVQTVSDITSLYRVAKESPLGIAMHRHATRNCLYKDELWCEYNGRGNIERLRTQVQQYKNDGFPENFGLCEGTIIVTDLKNEKAPEIYQNWWNEFCRSESGRDQISFPYVLWKMGYHIQDIGDLGNDEYRNPKFRISAHTGKTI